MMMSWFSPRNVPRAVSLKTLAYLKIQSQVSDGSHASPFLPLWAIAFSVGLLTASTISTNSSLPGTTDLKNINKANPQNAIVGRELIKEREKHMGADVSIFYREAGGLVITSGDGVYLQDIDGNRYLDCINNVAVVGHSHPTVVTAGQVELGKIQTNTRFLNPVQQRYVKKLLATLPPDLDTIYFVNSGSEANELALRLAKSHSTAARPDHVICIDSAYHGNTQTLIGISPYKWSQATDGKNYRPPTTHVVSLPDGYRGKYPAGQTPLAGELYAAEVEDLVSGPEGGVGVFIAEGIVGCGGQIVLPPGYLQKCYGEVRRRGGVCIADEVQTGFGRTGNKFWMFEEYGVVPDIVTLGKPMGMSSFLPPSLLTLPLTLNRQRLSSRCGCLSPGNCRFICCLRDRILQHLCRELRRLCHRGSGAGHDL
jgi:4-aminobutyrate aminotransferase-like enzyme